MPLPNNATFAQLAEEIGATEDEITHLPGNVRNLTKGDLIDLWGVQDANAAVSAYQQGRTENISAKVEGRHLTLRDVASIQSVFSPARVNPVIGGGLQPPAGVTQAAEGISIYCCCCPCCCAAASIQPIKRL